MNSQIRKTLTMSDRQEMGNEIEDEQADNKFDDNNGNNSTTVTELKGCNRKDRRNALKKEKRKKRRQEMAELARREEEARLHDPKELMRRQAEEEQERLRMEKERREFEERERKIMEEWERRKAEEQREEEERRRAQEEEEQLKQNQIGDENEEDDNGWEYVEDGSPEIIWQGNEIIVKKKKIRVKKKDTDQHVTEEDPNRPTSNPLPPQSEAFADYKNLSAQELLENVAQETPNFGTEQDKAHCPFHLKTGACRFGPRCSRIHFYPDKSCTLLIKNMYNGPGLAWEQDEGLEHTDEEVERAYEEFYEDVHTEFLKFGEIVNFKVCRNGSSHLRGNVYVHYKHLESAVVAYQSVNGRYYAGKQIQCEFVGVTRWKVAICGEFMKSKLQTCSRGTACNFIHCFWNPGGDYEWADWDKPPPRYWLKKMAALFGNSDEYGFDKQIRGSIRISSDNTYRHHGRHRSQRSQSRETYDSRRSRKDSEGTTRNSVHGQHCRTADRKQLEVRDEDTSKSIDEHHSKNRKLESRSGKRDGMSMHDSCSDSDDYNHQGPEQRNRRHKEKRHKSSHSTGSKGHWSDKDSKTKALKASGVIAGSSQQNQEFTTPDDHWDAQGSTHDGNLYASWSDEERDSAHIYKGKSPRQYSTEDFEEKKCTRQSTHRRKHSSSMGEPEKHYNNHLKKSKGKRDTEEKFDSDNHEAKSSRSAEARINEVIDRRGRWEPDKDVPT